MPVTFGDLRSSIDDLAGLDLDDDQRDALLNEAHREIATRSEWYRAEIELATTVADQAAYSLPSDVYRILWVRVDGDLYGPSDREQVDRLTNGWDTLNISGLWYQSWGTANEREVSLYPVPTESDLSITALVIERPALMTDDEDVPVVPEEFRQSIVDKAAAIHFGSVEDNPDLRTYYEEQFDRRVAELRRLTFSTGRSIGGWGVV